MHSAQFLLELLLSLKAFVLLPVTILGNYMLIILSLLCYLRFQFCIAALRLIATKQS